MTAPHGQGPPRSTAADALALIVAHYAATASRGAWAPGTAYAIDDTVSGTVGGRPWPYRCFAAGTSDSGAGPTGIGSQRAANGVAWTPVVYVGERYLKQHGAPPRVVFLIGNAALGGTMSSRIGDGNVATNTSEIRAYVWAAETPDDLNRYAAIESALDVLVNMVRKCLPGRSTARAVNATVEANVVTFGEDRQVLITYERQVPRDAAILAVPVTPAPTLDVMRPNGDLGTAYVVNPTTNGSH